MKRLLCLALLLCVVNQPLRVKAESYLVTESNPVFNFDILPLGYGMDSTYYTTRELTNPELQSLLTASKSIKEILNLNSSHPVNISVITNDVPNAFAAPMILGLSGDAFLNTNANLTLTNNIDLGNLNLTYLNIGNGYSTSNPGWGYNSKPYALHQSYYGDLTGTIKHELFHALGMMSQSGSGSFDPYFSGRMLLWDSYLRVAKPTIDANGNVSSIQEVASSVDIPVVAQPTPEPDVLTNFDVYSYAPYFVGSETMKVLSGKDGTVQECQNEIISAGGLKNYSGSYMLSKPEYPLSFGLPVNAYEGTVAEMTHIELRNSFMSHQVFRNWYMPMEAELAALKDLGFNNIKLRDYFGKSYYLNGNKNTTWLGNNDGVGFGKWDENLNKYIAGSYSQITNGVGLHIYGDNNEITQKANILSEGAATIGARIDGVANKYTLGENYVIDTKGDNSIGIATTFGKDHVLNLEKNSLVSALGKNGIALSFDFGQNFLGAELATKGSYIYHDGRFASPEMDVNAFEPDISGALVKELNIDGKVEGKNAAIYIADNALVENINISETAEIKGDIISNWNSQVAGPYANVQLDETKFTDVNFNLDTQIATVENPYEGFEGNILGNNDIQNTLRMNVKSGVLKYNGVADVNSISIDENARLTGNGVYKTDKFVNMGDYDINQGSLLDAQIIQNSGSINVGADYLLTKNIEGVTNQSGSIDVGTLNLNNGTLYLADNIDSIESYLAFDGGSLSLINNSTDEIEISGIDLYKDSNLNIDIDFSSQKADSLIISDTNAIGQNSMDGKLVISNVNMMNLDKNITDKQYKFDIFGENSQTSELANNLELNLANEEIITPIYQYRFGFSSKQPGSLLLSQYAYNPAVLAAPVATQVGGYLTQLHSYDMAFGNMDMNMLMSNNYRQAMKFRNKYAMNTVQSGNNLLMFDPNQLPQESRGLWFKPFATFEKVGLDNGPKVENQSYGMFFGGDSELISLKRGWDAVFSTYAGYTGSHQHYSNTSIYQNGGSLGVSGVFYKGNLFTGITTNIGASVAEASTLYGSEDITMLMTGIASKTGYNWELADSKFIVQPSLLMSYSFINTYDYKNSANVSIDSDPLHALQIAPGIKFIGNLKNNWQPYLTVQMVWNLIDKARFSANNISLSQMSVEPYIQYGVGVQKRWGERFSGFGQTLIRNGSRNGIALSLGFRWAIGK